MNGVYQWMKEKKEEFFTARGYEIAAGDDALTPSMEDYLEMIYRASQEKGHARVNDIAARLNVQPPSVTKMMRKLHEKKLLDYERYGFIRLTEEGRDLGRFLLERHNVLGEFFTLLGLENNLQEKVEGIEHYIPWKTFQTIRGLVNFLKDHPEVLEKFQAYLEESGAYY